MATAFHGHQASGAVVVLLASPAVLQNRLRQCSRDEYTADVAAQALGHVLHGIKRWLTLNADEAGRIVLVMLAGLAFRAVVALANVFERMMFDSWWRRLQRGQRTHLSRTAGSFDRQPLA